MNTPRLRKFDVPLIALEVVSLAIGALAGWCLSNGGTPTLPTQHISGLFIDANAKVCKPLEEINQLYLPSREGIR
jgi:hypothetical protein